VKQILFAHMTPQGVKTMKNLGYSHPQNFIHENPDWLLNRKIYIPQKFPGMNKLVFKRILYRSCEDAKEAIAFVHTR